MNAVVLDASAVLAVLQDEPGRDFVREHLRGALISAVNLAEVGARLADRGSSQVAIQETFDNLALTVAAFDVEAAMQSIALRFHTRHRGLSLGDRACLALAVDRATPALTADRSWSDLDVGVEIRLIRD